MREESRKITGTRPYTSTNSNGYLISRLPAAEEKLKLHLFKTINHHIFPYFQLKAVQWSFLPRNCFSVYVSWSPFLYFCKKRTVLGRAG